MLAPIRAAGEVVAFPGVPAPEIDAKDFTEPCAGLAVFGDIILFTEPVLGGTFDRPSLLGHRRIMGQVVGDNAGVDRRGHHFALQVLASDGCDALQTGQIIRRKASTVYRFTTRRRPWESEAERARLLIEADRTLPEARKGRAMRQWR